MATSSYPNVDRRDDQNQSSSSLSITCGSPPESDSEVDEVHAGEQRQRHGASSSESVDRNLPYQTSSHTSEATTSQHVKPGRSRQNKIHGLLGAKFFDSKVPTRKKLKWLNRLASVQADGTVQFEIPDEIRPHNLEFGTRVTGGATEDEDFDTTAIPDFPPLQIVMLIVGTRGDVQPFVAIGKHLQLCQEQVIYCQQLSQNKLIRLALFSPATGSLWEFSY